MHKKQNIVFFCIIFMAIFLCTFALAKQNKELSINNGPETVSYTIKQQALISQDGSLFKEKTEKTKKILVVITAYSSTVDQTDDTPFITANGTLVRDGIVANNMLPFGTKIKIPELYGDKEFVVQDRMNARKSNYHIDIWFPSYAEAKDFGVKKTYIEVAQS
ncbi:MAG: hypothetical protein WC427_03660 [Candidatus Paceibacterota bacterium]